MTFADKAGDGRAISIRTLVIASGMALFLSAEARGGEMHILHGLFCNSESQVEQTVAHMQANVAPRIAVELTNEKEVACVYADRIRYMVVRPLIIGEVRYRGTPFMKYEATLVGVMVGDNPRPVEPPVPIYFIDPERLPGAVSVGGA